MSKKDRKRQREEAIHAEIARRVQAHKDQSPLSRDDMLELIGFVGEKVMIEGHSHDFTHTNKWLQKNNFDQKKAFEFFNCVKIVDDWSLCIEGDPFVLLGVSSDRLSWMPIDRPHLESLIDWLGTEIPKRGCKHDMALTTEWLGKHDCPIHPTLMALLAHGGGCDCEVIFNVESKVIYP